MLGKRECSVHLEAAAIIGGKVVVETDIENMTLRPVNPAKFDPTHKVFDIWIVVIFRDINANPGLDRVRNQESNAERS